MATALTSLVSSPRRPAWIKGRLRGALICGTFGAVWMFEALFFGGIATPAWLTIIGVLTVAVIVWPVILLRSLRGAVYSAADRKVWAALKVPYWVNVAVEWVFCIGAAFWLAHLHRYSLIPVCVGAIVGLHFLPLARIFKSPVYYATGAAMIFGSVGSLAMHEGPMRNIVAFGIDGLSLWVTSAFILAHDWLSKREEEN